MNNKQNVVVLLAIIMVVCGAFALRPNVNGRQTPNSRELSFTYVGERLHIADPRGATHYIRYNGHIDDTLIFATSFSNIYAKVGESFSFAGMTGQPPTDMFTVISVSEDYQLVLVILVVDKN